MVSQSRFLFVLTLLPLLACTAVQQQKQAAATRPDNLEFHNLRVLPQNISKEELENTMRFFARSLGVRCSHCHAANAPGAKPALNFASDAKSEKDTARAMMRMSERINKDYISKVATHDGKVTCMTCHRGKTVPNDFDPAPAPPPAPPARPEGAGGPGAPPPSAPPGPTPQP